MDQADPVPKLTWHGLKTRRLFLKKNDCKLAVRCCASSFFSDGGGGHGMTTTISDREPEMEMWKSGRTDPLSSTFSVTVGAAIRRRNYDSGEPINDKAQHSSSSASAGTSESGSEPKTLFLVTFYNRNPIDSDVFESFSPIKMKKLCKSSNGDKDKFGSYGPSEKDSKSDEDIDLHDFSDNE